MVELEWRVAQVFRLLTNRVIIGMVAFFVLVGLWEFRWKPQYRPHYEMGISHYQGGRFSEAVDEFQQAYAIAPNSLDVILMLGWAHYKVNHFEEARFFFDRALRINANTQEAQLGSAFVALETGRGTLNVDLIRDYLGNRGGDPAVRTLSAAALSKEGRHFEAAAVYRGLVADREYGEGARAALQAIYGLEESTDTAPAEFPPLVRPAALTVRYWAGDRAFWRLEGAEWRRLYVAGVNFGAVAPGFYPSAPPNNVSEYSAWLDRAAALNANVLRVYSLLPPAFYRAYKTHATSGRVPALFQQVWIGDPPDRDLFDPAFLEQTRGDIRHVVDALHGRGEVPAGRGLKGGIYDQDVAASVAGILLGRELEPSTVAQTNVLNAGERTYRGRYVQIASGTATEVWIARMLDYLVEYETTTYNHQHPVAFVNWPPLDPILHPTEGTTLQELRYRLARGEEEVDLPSGPQDDADVVSVDESKFTTTPEFVAGMFAAYQVYPHWPDFLINDPGLLASRDSAGPNPVFGYLRQLGERLSIPLVITEFGVPNSIGASHLHPQGWDHGGHSETDQAELLARLARTVKEAGAAGGVAFALHDEWYKQNWLVRRFESPEDRSTLWLNELNPDQRFGLLGFRTSKATLYGRSASPWDGERALYTNTVAPRAPGDPFEGARTLRELKAAADEAYLYLRLVVGCLDCAPGERRSDGRPRFDRASYAVTINTLPGAAGLERLPFGNVSIPSGANFVLLLTDPEHARLLAASNYNPYEIGPTPGIPSETDLRIRWTLDTTRTARGSFGEITVEPNRRRYTRDGRVLAPIRSNRSLLRYGMSDAPAADNDSSGEWYADLASSSILIRIPWNKLFVTDPSSHAAFTGFDGTRVRTATMDGIEVAVFALAPSGSVPASDPRAWSIASSLPQAAGGALTGIAKVTWPGWNAVKLDVYEKRAYGELQKLFAEQSKALTGPGTTRPVSSVSAGTMSAGSR